MQQRCSLRSLLTRRGRDLSCSEHPKATFHVIIGPPYATCDVLLSLPLAGGRVDVRPRMVARSGSPAFPTAGQCWLDVLDGDGAKIPYKQRVFVRPMTDSSPHCQAGVYEDPPPDRSIVR